MYTTQLTYLTVVALHALSTLNTYIFNLLVSLELEIFLRSNKPIKSSHFNSFMHVYNFQAKIVFKVFV